MSFTLFADESQADLYPLTLTRPLFDLRCGIFTMREKWEKALGHPVTVSAPGHLDPYFSDYKRVGGNIWINAKFYPVAELVKEIREITAPGTVIVNES